MDCAHGACAASARREGEAMSLRIVDDEQRSDRRATPMRPSDSGGAGASAALALLDDVQPHRLRLRLASAPARSAAGATVLGTRPLIIPGQAPSPPKTSRPFPGAPSNLHA